jgi:hypothetical protein
MHLPDPRRYLPPNARNPAIRLVMKQLAATDDAASSALALKHTLSDLLLAGDHASLNAALTQAPALEAAQALWHSLRDIIEAPAALNLFLIPVVLVAGVKGNATLPGELADPDAITSLLRRHTVLDNEAPVWLARELVAAEELAAVSPARLLHWRDDTTIASLGLPSPLELVPITLRDEGVFLRFIVGATSGPMPLNPRIGAWGLPLAELIGQQLATEGVTLFTIPRAPQGWLSALESGRTTLLETRLQHMTSNAVRGIRLKGRTPIATLAAHDNDEIRITISSQEDGERWYGFVWPLSPRDEVTAIERFATELFVECQISDIRIVPDLQPDLQDDLPFFVTAHAAPVQAD